MFLNRTKTLTALAMLVVAMPAAVCATQPAARHNADGFRPAVHAASSEPARPRGPRSGERPLSDQIKSLDWRARKAKVICAAPTEVTEEVLAKLSTLIS